MVMCEKPLGRTAAEGRAHGRRPSKQAGVANMVWYNYRRVPAVTLAKQLIDEGRLGRIFHYRAKFLQDWTISKDLPQGGAGLWRLDAERGRQRRHRRSAGALHRHRHVAQRPHRRGHGDDRDLHQGAHAHPDRQGASRSASTTPAPSWPASATARSAPSRRPATRAATRRSTRSRSTASTPRSRGTCTICTGSQYFDHGDEGQLRGWRSIHITDGDHPYMKHWWVPGLQIGYEHTLHPPGRRFPRRPRRRHGRRRRPSARRWRPIGSPTRCWRRPPAGNGSRLTERDRAPAAPGREQTMTMEETRSSLGTGVGVPPLAIEAHAITKVVPGHPGARRCRLRGRPRRGPRARRQERRRQVHVHEDPVGRAARPMPARSSSAARPSRR